MRRALAVAALAAVPLAFAPTPASAQVVRQFTPRERVAIFLVSGMSFEQFMRVPEFRSLARVGGAGLMSFRFLRGDRGPGLSLTLGAGARSIVPFGTVRIVPFGTAGVPAVSSHRIRVRRWRAIVDANAHRSTPGALGALLEIHGMRACADSGRSVLVSVDRRGQTITAPVAPPVGNAGTPNCSLTAFSLIGASPLDAGRMAARIVQANFSDRLRVIVLQASPSRGMLARNDELTPIVIADGTPQSLFDRHGPMHTLTSDTTRRDGVVSNEDVAPTVLSYLHIPVPPEMNGAPIRFVRGSPPPFALHRRHLGERRLTVPIQVGLGIAELIAGLLAWFVIWRKPRRPAIANTAAALTLSMAILGVAALAAGGLPTISYGWVLPFLVLVPAVFAPLALRLLRERSALLPAAAIGASILVFFVLEALHGWPDAMTTLFGGSELDGGRFYGMGNIEVGLVLGASLWVASMLPTMGGFLLLLGAGMFAGFPDLGVNFGGAITLFAAAGLWLMIRTRRRLGLRELVIAGVISGAGLAVVVGANLIWAKHPTHGAHFVQHARSHGVSGLARFVWDRLLVGWHLLVHAPMSWIPVLGLVPLLYFVLRPTPTLQAAFRRYPAWRDALLVLVVASMIAYVVNDSGAAAVGWGFGLAAAGIFYLPLVEETWRTARDPTPR